jgi:hypothetical protein
MQIKIKIVNTNGDKYTADLDAHEDLIVHKENQQFKSLIEKVLRDSKMEEIDEVKITVKMEW